MSKLDFFQKIKIFFDPEKWMDHVADDLSKNYGWTKHDAANLFHIRRTRFCTLVTLNILFPWQPCYLKTGRKKVELASKLAINKKSTIFAQFSWNFVKMTNTSVRQIAKVSGCLDENWGFFVNGQFLASPIFFGPLSMYHGTSIFLIYVAKSAFRK